MMTVPRAFLVGGHFVYRSSTAAICTLRRCHFSVNSLTVRTKDNNSRMLENEKFRKLRLEIICKQTSVDFYPHKFQPTTTVKEFVDNFPPLDSDVESAGERETVRLCGRVCGIRNVGKKLRFLDLHQGDSRVQIKAQEEFYAGDFALDVGLVKRGDILGVEGFPSRTRSKEPSLMARNLNILAPTLRIPPSSQLEDTEERFRRRYVDLMLNAETRGIFRARCHIIRQIRSFLEDRNFLEVETPILLNGDGGGGAPHATPFRSYHEDLKMQMLLRMAPELHLKMLVVGGFDRVFEIGRQFRNEGVDSSHNPEFTSCEFYMTHTDYKDLMDMTEDMLSSVVQHLRHQQHLQLEEKMLQSFEKTPYKRLDFVSSLESATGNVFPNLKQESQESVVKFLLDLCHHYELHLGGGGELTTSKLLDKLFSKLVERELMEPTFVLNHPLCMCPLAKRHHKHKHLAERFELFVGGLELVNAYTELNDPQVQKAEFLKQPCGVSDKCRVFLSSLEEEYVNALEYGMPPTAGWGLGVDRLVMILTGRTSIREVLLFPTMKPKANN